MATSLDCDALAVLVVRLAGNARPAGDLRWHHWHEISGAGEQGLDADSSAEECSPHKQLPLANRQPYFTPHVQRLLYPPPPSPASAGAWTGERRMCCPSELWLDVGWNEHDVRRARVELLERLSIPLEPRRTVGVIHLALEPGAGRHPMATLKWASDLRHPFTRAGRPRFTLVDSREERVLDGRLPLRALVQALFGDPDEAMERHFYPIVFAKEPAPADASVAHHAVHMSRWRGALARGSRRVSGDPRAEDHEHGAATAQHASLGVVDAVVLGRAAAFTVPASMLDGKNARNFRSYWSESLLFALLQHDRLEHLAGRLAELGFDPSTESIDHLFEEWLAFRNVLWWSQLSTTTEVPQTLASLLRGERGTERMFAELEGDFATYTTRRRWRMEDEQARALANLQIYGAAVAVTGALATLAALLRPTGALLALAVCIVLLAGVTAGAFVRSRVPRRVTSNRR